MKCIGLYITKSIRIFIIDKDTGKFIYLKICILYPVPGFLSNHFLPIFLINTHACQWRTTEITITQISWIFLFDMSLFYTDKLTGMKTIFLQEFDRLTIFDNFLLNFSALSSGYFHVVCNANPVDKLFQPCLTR